MERKKLGQWTFFDWLMHKAYMFQLRLEILNWKIGNVIMGAKALLVNPIPNLAGKLPQPLQKKPNSAESNKKHFGNGFGGGSLGLGLQDWRSSNNIPIPSNSNQPVQFTARNVSVYTDGNGRNTIKVDGGQVSLPYLG